MHKLRSFLAGLVAFGGLALTASAGERTDYPAAARQLYERGQEHLQKGRYGQAIQAFEEAMRQGMKDYPRAHLGRARSTLFQKDYDAAITRYTDFIERFGLEDSCRH